LGRQHFQTEKAGEGGLSRALAHPPRIRL
jgi:hypothetical protein